MGKIIAYACCCHVGRKRKENQDNYLCEGLYRHIDRDTKVYPLTGETSMRKPSVFGVFDGLGGEQDGEIASYLASSLAARFSWGRHQEKDLTTLCFKINRAICGYVKETGLQSAGTTAAMVSFFGRRMVVCNIGDSRVFHVRDGSIRQISKDHVDLSSGSAKPPLSQCLGIPEEELQIVPYVARISYKIGDRFLLCSDGITDMLSEETILEIVEKKSVKKAARNLIRCALDAGGRDNATLILLEIQNCR